ncbi:MAG: hypothetical protein H7236_03465 [Gemmatimonadaceae bacterium]|nr:hypothetical protein [Caulobacter sp.]
MRKLFIRAESLLITMFARRTLKECREKISEIIGEAVVENDDARRHGLLTLADLWVELTERREAEYASHPNR